MEEVVSGTSVENGSTVDVETVVLGASVVVVEEVVSGTSVENGSTVDVETVVLGASVVVSAKRLTTSQKLTVDSAKCSVVVESRFFRKTMTLCFSGSKTPQAYRPLSIGFAGPMSVVP